MDKKAFKKQWQNYWYYNKAKTLVGVFILIVVISLTLDLINKKEMALEIYLLNGYAQETKTAELEEQLIHDLNLTKDHMISIKSISDENTSNDVQTAFQVKLATGEIDVLVLNESEFYSFAKEEAFMNLSSEGDFLQDIDVQFLGKSPTDTDTLYGIKLPEDSALNSLGYDTKNKVIAIMNISERKENALKFIKVVAK